ncbi:uncharacterized protein AKAW2_61348A [Aspergillus luchuensis]|uniref:Uncharacterized protein n=1 Tax=Aspergillus kawachii TaxID=1069201 RepID=A0A7R8A1U3_ASPKA|nr:uncharacterized protein AKAW2_61348A [Aspergillus luchuensis]BCS03084.1 hypothetical protein AKAW2_61348A [Aspergillus luchuensis]
MILARMVKLALPWDLSLWFLIILQPYVENESAQLHDGDGSFYSIARERAIAQKNFLNDDNHVLILFSFCSVGLTPFFFYLVCRFSCFFPLNFPPFSIQSIELT